MKILVVDDNADARGLLCALLTKLGNEVAGAECGQTALELARQIRPDAVVFDITMPGMNGYELATNLRGECGLQTARLIALSGHAPDEERCRAAGIDHYLVKPVRGQLLMELLKQPVAG